MKEVDLKKELDTWRHNHFHGRRDNDYSGEYYPSRKGESKKKES